MRAQAAPEPKPVDAMRSAYEKQYPEFKGVASQAARNHYGVFMTGWYAHAAAKTAGSQT